MVAHCHGEPPVTTHALEEELRAAQERIAELEAAKPTTAESLCAYLDHASDALFLSEAATGRVLDANQRACDTLQYSLDELRQMRAVDIEAMLDRKSVV